LSIQAQISILFERERSVITKRIHNIFADGELDEKSNVQNLNITNSDEPVAFYGSVSREEALDKANSEYQKYKQKMIDELSPVEQGREL
jgi:hypothetical protein